MDSFYAGPCFYVIIVKGISSLKLVWLFISISFGSLSVKKDNSMIKICWKFIPISTMVRKKMPDLTHSKITSLSIFAVLSSVHFPFLFFQGTLSTYQLQLYLLLCSSESSPHVIFLIDIMKARPPKKKFEPCDLNVEKEWEEIRLIIFCSQIFWNCGCAIK